MAARYLVSGVQLGMLKALAKAEDVEGVCKLATDIEEKQYVGHSSGNMEEDANSLLNHLRKGFG